MLSARSISHRGNQLRKRQRQHYETAPQIARFPRLEDLEKDPNWWRKPANHRQWLDWLRLQLNHPKDDLSSLYDLKELQIQQYGGAPLLAQYTHHIDAITTLYPEHKWQMWRFYQVPRGWWQTPAHQRAFLDWLRTDVLGHAPDDFESLYKLSSNTVIENYGATLIVKEYKASVHDMVSKIYPEHTWLPWLFLRTKQEWFSSVERQKEFFEWFRTKNHFPTLDDLYHVSYEQIEQSGGAPLLARHYSSIRALLVALYPSHEWLPWKFTHAELNWWASKVNQRTYFAWLLSSLGLSQKRPEDFYGLSTAKIKRLHGTTFLAQYGGSPYRAVKALFPGHRWLPWKFGRTSHRWWDTLDNQRVFVEWIREQTNTTERLEECYNITFFDYKNFGGRTLLAKYKNSPAAIMRAVFSNHAWREWKFPTVSASFWRKSANVRRFLDDIKADFGYEATEDVYSVTAEAILANGGRQLLDQFNQRVDKIVAFAYPEHKWNRAEFTNLKQEMLHKMVQRLHPASSPYFSLQTRIVSPPLFYLRCLWGTAWKYRDTSLLFNARSARTLELDSYSPDLRLAFEFQGQQHFFDVVHFGEVLHNHNRDSAKAVACAAQNLRLVEVPYWWIGSKRQLLQTLQLQNV